MKANPPDRSVALSPLLKLAYRIINKASGSVDGGHSCESGFMGELTPLSMHRIVCILRSTFQMNRLNSIFVDLGYFVAHKMFIICMPGLMPDRSGMGKPSLHIGVADAASISLGVEIDGARQLQSNVNLLNLLTDRSCGMQAWPAVLCDDVS
jgi:hypothetical protein